MRPKSKKIKSLRKTVVTADLTNRVSAARAIVDSLRADLPKEVDVAALGVKSKGPFQLLCTREALIWRIEELGRNACDALERDDFAAAALLTRAVTETAALTWKLMELLQSRQNYSSEELSEHFIRALMGSKSKDDKDAGLPQAFNVLTLINRMDRTIEGVEHMYGALSEMAHPNWSGTLALYGKMDRAKYITTFGHAQEHAYRNRQMIVSALIGSLGGFQFAYNKIADGFPAYLKEHESLWPRDSTDPSTKPDDASKP